MKEYCQNCKQLLPSGILARISKELPIEFEDGKYCQRCGVAKIKREREKVYNDHKN